MQTTSEKTAAPLSPCEKVALAQLLFRDHYIECFWHMKPDLVVTEATLPLIIAGLRSYGGRREFLEAARLAE